MSKPLAHDLVDKEKQRKLHRLLVGSTFTYHNSRDRRKSPAVFAMARKLADQGHIQIAQKRNENGSMDYIATGLLTENRKHKMKTRC